MRLLWSAVQDIAIEELRTMVLRDAKLVGSVTLSDLVAPSPEASTGLYFFVNGNDFEYIGKASSRALIERVPAHLDLRETGWFGTLLRRLAERGGVEITRPDVVPDALRLRLTVLFKDVPLAATKLGEVETGFRRMWQPRLNLHKSRSQSARSLRHLVDGGTTDAAR
jgi:hypothetical protein